jgi:hypothetical protein
MNSTIPPSLSGSTRWSGDCGSSPPANVIASAEQVMQRIVETYYLPNRDFSNPEEKPREDIDMLRAFSEACRQDLGV